MPPHCPQAIQLDVGEPTSSSLWHYITEPLTSTVQPLPVEVIEWTLDFLHNDVNALKACSLVCKAWLPTTRFHLFQSSVIPTGKKAVVLFEQLSLRESTLCNAITDLHLGRGKLWQLTKSYLDGIAELTALRSLALVRVDVRRLSPKAVENLKAIDLRRLYFSGVKADTIDELMQIPCIFSSLECLSLRDISIDYHHSTLDLHLPPTLRELNIESDISSQIHWPLRARPNGVKSNSGLVRWVLLHEPIPPIATLSLGATEPSCGKITAMLNKTLEHLELKLSTWPDYGTPHLKDFRPFLDSIDLSACVRLRSLRIIHPYLKDLAKFASKIFGRLQSPIIQSVAICSLNLKDLIDSKSVPSFRTLGQVLSKHLNSLTEVILESDPMPSVDEAEQLIKDTMGCPVGDLVRVRAYEPAIVDVREMLGMVNR